MVSGANDPAIHLPGTSTLAMALLFGSIAFATAAIGARTYLMGDMRALRSAYNCTKADPLDVSSLSSIYTLLFNLMVFGLILLFAYICEFHPPFPHGEKSYDRDEFMFLTILMFVAAAFTVSKNDKSSASGAVRHGKLSDKEINNADSSTKALPRKISHKSVLKGETNNEFAPPGTSPRKTEGEAKSQFQGNDSIDSFREDKSDGEEALVDVSLTEDDVRMLVAKSHDSTRKKAHIASGLIYPRPTSLYASGPVVGAVSPVKACNDVLNRDQTEEWKGWMQFMFLFYHYYHAEEVYNAIRVMITCYVWMTGFGNFSFFYLKDDYSIVRVLQMLWRLNFLVLFLCLSQGTTYLLYYICPLHTYFFLMVCATMRIAKQINYSRYGLRGKLFAVAICIYLVWDLDIGLFSLIHRPFLGETPTLGAGNGSLWEWYFRSTLDHWSTFLGMIFAANFPIVSLFFRKLEAQPFLKQWLAKGAIGAGLLVIFTIWFAGPFRAAKLQYNSTNCYFGFVPLITYIYFRNLAPTLRSYTLNLLHQIGKTTLETYLMQHHIWLTSDAKSLLILIPGWPKVNMVLVTVIYYLVSRKLYKLTLFLRGMVLPNDVNQCARNLGWMTFIIVLFNALAYSMTTINIVSFSTVSLVSVLVGMLLYQAVIDVSWRSFKESSPPPADVGLAETGRRLTDSDSIVAKLSPPLIGTLVLLILGTFHEGMVLNGSGKTLPLKASCEASVNSGMWIPVDGCNEYQRGVGYRNYGVSEFATCSGSYVWGWNAVPSNSHCKFYSRSASQLKTLLEGRRITFVGDSMTRNVYHAFRRIMGDIDAGAYDGLAQKHSDISKSIDATSLDFKWAPLAVEAVKKLKDIRAGEEESIPDLILIGGGAWDRLHLWATDEDQKSLKVVLHDLALEMAAARGDGVPIVWFNPTTINTAALVNEDKQDHMREEDMREVRELYAQLGIWGASTFVLDGTAFTKGRVEESFDGVHYPPQIYNAGAQMLANAMDWIIRDRVDGRGDFVAPQPGKMSNPYLGFMMLCIAFVGLFFFDGFLGFSYLGSVFVKGVMPIDLYEDAFIPLHQKMKLPVIERSGSLSEVEMDVLLKHASP